MAEKHGEFQAGVEEIQSLSADDLDVEELEQRLELASGDCPDCWTFDCATFCTEEPTIEEPG